MPQPDFMLFVKHCPVRPPDWRWQQARYRWEHPEDRLPPINDAWIAKTFKLQSVMAGGTGRDELVRLFSFAKDYLFALDIWTNTQRMTRTALEARLLADESRADIAKKFGLRKEDRPLLREALLQRQGEAGLSGVRLVQRHWIRSLYGALLRDRR